ncbi:helix-turn-helix domain-containing protein [Streptomyces sp. NPDC094448]|uniref:helix-turn-helix domain-containing protein n=1 Tax=Streptomyces sp. NPDC094448 TaxID=3366063 RepID=UPI0037FD3A45
MPTIPLVPTVRRRRLGSQVRRYRNDAGMSAEAAARAMGWDPGKLSRIEHAKAALQPKDVAPLLALYGVTEEAAVVALVAMAKDAGRKGWWTSYSDVVASSYADLIALEADAEGIREWSPYLVPGLLQTPAYARETIAAHALTRTPQEVHALSEVRVARQSVLSRPGGEPLRYVAVIGEAALHQRFASRPETMRDQIRRLIETTEVPGITLQVMPLDATPHPGGAGGFSLFGFAQPLPGVVQIENLKGTSYAEGDEIRLFDDAFGRIVGAALSTDDSLAFLQGMEKRYYR